MTISRKVFSFGCHLFRDVAVTKPRRIVANDEENIGLLSLTKVRPMPSLFLALIAL